MQLQRTKQDSSETKTNMWNLCNLLMERLPETISSWAYGPDNSTVIIEFDEFNPWGVPGDIGR